MGGTKYQKLVESQSKLPHNDRCIDCGSKDPKWASTRYGTFFCLECAAIHRSLGVYLDFVKSVRLDDWDKNSFLPIEHGGNLKFQEYLNINGLSHLKNEDRYRNLKVIEYTKILSKKIFDETGVELRSSEKKETIGKVKHRRDDSSSDCPKVREYEQEKSTDSKIYNSSTLSNSLSSLRSIIGDNVKVIAEKTVEYGSKIGSTVKYHAKNILDKSSETLTGLKKEKGSPVEMKKPGPKKMTKSCDWS